MLFLTFKLVAFLVFVGLISVRVIPNLERNVRSRAARLKGGLAGMLCTGLLGLGAVAMFSNPILLFLATFSFGGVFAVSGLVVYRVLAGSDLPERV